MLISLALSVAICFSCIVLNRLFLLLCEQPKETKVVDNSTDEQKVMENTSKESTRGISNGNNELLGQPVSCFILLSVSHFLCLSVILCMCLSSCLSQILCTSLILCLFVSLSISLSVCLCMSFFLSLSLIVFCLSLVLSICL